jgi:hypothetical protein
VFFWFTVYKDLIGFQAAICGFDHGAVAPSVCGLYAFCQIYRIPTCSHHEPLLTLLPRDVLRVRQFIVGVVAVFVRDLVARRALPEEGIGDKAVDGTLLLKAVAGQSDVDPPVL